MPGRAAETDRPRPEVGAVRHPARFTDAELDRMDALLADYCLVLDPFAGTGRVHELRHGRETWGIEIEPEWATMHPRTIVGDALSLPFPTATFDAIVTSPCWGNRLADHHNAQDGSERRSYRHDLKRELHRHNAGSLQWGPDYRTFHERAWAESLRVLKSGGDFLLSISDHIRHGQTVPVSAWHAGTLEGLGCELNAAELIETRRLRYGANRDRRVPHSWLMVFEGPT